MLVEINPNFYVSFGYVDMEMLLAGWEINNYWLLVTYKKKKSW